MFTVTVEDTFSATHRVHYTDGTLEPIHGHDWVVRVHFCRSSLDDHGMVVDFIKAQTILKTIVSDLQYKNLNEVEYFADFNPTAEMVAKYIFDKINEKFTEILDRVEVTEAPGCVAGYDRTTSCRV